MSGDRPGRMGQRLIAWELAGRLPSWVSRLVQARVARDAEWQATYDVLRRAERAAEGGSALSAAQRRRIEAGMFALLDEEDPQKRMGWPRLAIASTFAGALVVAIIGVGAARDDDDDWLARGAQSGALGMKVRCVVEEVERPRVLGVAVATDGISGRLTCPTGALLAFSLTNFREHDRFAFIVGLDAGGALRFVSPFVEDSESVRVSAGSVDQLLPVLADTAPFAGDARVTLYALFSDAPLTGGSLRRTIEGAALRGLAVGALDRLPVSSDVQARIDVVLEGRDP